MELCSKYGISTVTDDQLELFRRQIKKLALTQWAYCYSQTGFFNADMHDGNIMVSAENGELSIYFIDFGNAQRVSRDTVIATYSVINTMQALRSSSNDLERERYADDLITCLKNMGEYEPETADWVRLKQEIMDLLEPESTDPIESKVIDVFNLAFPCNIRISKEITSLFRAMLLIEGQGFDYTSAAASAKNQSNPLMEPELD